MKRFLDIFRSKTFIFTVVALASIGNLFYGFALYSESKSYLPDDEGEGYGSIYKLMFVINRVRKDYVDAEKVSYTNIVKGALKGIMSQLDPFCAYMEPDTYKNMVDETEGREFGGVGMVVTYSDGALVVVAPMEDTPAFKAGIKPGDVILQIDGKRTSAMSLDECVKMLKGEPGTKVELQITREGVEEPLTVEILRENIEVSSVKGGKIIEDGIAYIRITQFNAPTASKLDEELLKLKEKGMTAIVVDLRGNPGGLLSSAIETCSRFIETGKLVLSTAGRDQSLESKYKALPCKKYLDSGPDGLPMVVLIDKNSASASEIFAGCMKDYKRAVLVGEKTFGKGSVQTILPLPEGAGAIRLTTAKYFTPNRLQIHQHGIEPDISVPMGRKLMEKIYRQRMVHPGVIKPDEPGAVSDVQLERAIEILKGVRIYKMVEG